MKTIRSSKNLKGRLKYPVLTLGNFDGVHKGHRKIIKKVMAIAKKKGGTSILYTFDPHPVKILCPQLAPVVLQTLDQKISTLKALGLDILVIEPFTERLAKLSASQFFNEIIVNRTRAKEIVVGYDFTFGRHRAGGAQYLKRLAAEKGIAVHIIDAIFFKESLLSSTHIRHFLERGDLASAHAMLGRPYSIVGTVVKGRGLGAELGFHTANLATKNELIPPTGVYITATRICRTGKKYKSAANIGYNPTFKGTDLSIETYLLDFNGDLLKQDIELEFHKKIRREMTFESTEELRNQITKDVEATRKYYEKRISL